MELIKAIYKARLNDERFETSCDNLHHLSAIGWNEYEDFEGEHFTRFKYGYNKLVEYLSSQVPKQIIRLNERVESIDWSSIAENDSSDDDDDDDAHDNKECKHSQLIKVHTYNTHEKQKCVYQAKKVLCTVPLGVLKRFHRDLFHPNLPSNKIRAIERLGFGCVNKLFIVFNKPLFKKNVQGMQIFWRNDINFELDYSNDKWGLQVQILIKF
jgi:spermine oxidase